MPGAESRPPNRAPAGRAEFRVSTNRPPMRATPMPMREGRYPDAIVFAEMCWLSFNAWRRLRALGAIGRPIQAVAAKSGAGAVRFFLLL